MKIMHKRPQILIGGGLRCAVGTLLFSPLLFSSLLFWVLRIGLAMVRSPKIAPDL